MSARSLLLFRRPIRRQFFVRLAVVFTVLGVVSAIVAQSPQQQPNEDKQRAKLQRARVLEEMHAMADAITVSKTAANKKVERIEAPLFRYYSPSRLHQDGTIWAWGKQGRPLVIMELFTTNTKRPDWIHGCVLTSTDLVELRRQGEKIWYPRDVGVQFKPIPDVTRPSEKKNIRLRQMKQLSRRFTAHEFWDPNNTRFDLRLLAQPVHRYDDPDQGITDGAVFLWAHEIEPEIIIMIEAVETDGAATWQYAVAPLGSAEFHVHLDDKEVYRCDRAPMMRGYPSDPYHSFHREAERK